MQTIAPKYNFVTHREGEFTRFTYQKSPLSYKALLPMCINTLLPAGYFTYLISPKTIASLLITFFVMLLGTSAIVIVVINFIRGSGEFKISKTLLVVDNKSYQLDHIKAFVIKDPNGGYIEHTVTVHTSHNPFNVASNVGKMQDQMVQIGRQGRAALKQHFRNVGYKIVMRYASKEVVVASGLNETEAETLFDKITEVAGYTTNG